MALPGHKMTFCLSHNSCEEIEVAFEEGREGDIEKLRLAQRWDRPEVEDPVENKGIHVIQRHSPAPPQGHASLRGMTCARLKESGFQAGGFSDSPGESQT